MFSNSSTPHLSEAQQTAFAVLLHRMINRIRHSLELPIILNATVAEVRAFLQTDRVKIYRFDTDGSGEVVAEAINHQRLPSLLNHWFPAEDIPPEARELFLRVRQRSIVDVLTQEIGVSPLLEQSDGATIEEELRFRVADPCHIEYLTALGVRSSLVVPIIAQEELWGLLVSHHCEPRRFTQTELQIMQLISDQVSIAIVQANILQETRRYAAQEATINQITSLLHALPEMQLQQALEQVIQAFQGVGGRLYIFPQGVHQASQFFVEGQQPVLSSLQNGFDRSAFPTLLEQHPLWQTWLELEPKSEGVWLINQVDRSEMPAELSTALISANLRSLLVIPIQYRQQTLGYLSVFRCAIDIERIWAGKLDQGDPRQRLPRLSFETWKELRSNQSQPWTVFDRELAHTLSHVFALAIHQRGLYQRVRSLNAHLKRDVKRRKKAEVELATLNSNLERCVLQRTMQLQRTNEELVRQIEQREFIIEERQRAEASIERLSHQNELILNSAGDGIYGIDAQGLITFVNSTAAKMLGYEVDDLVGQWMHTYLKHSKSDGIPYLLADSPIHTTLRKGTIEHRNGDVFQRRDGSTFPIEYVSSPIRECDRIVGAVIVFKDITERQMIEQMKDEFVSIVSHELRTPLTSIRSTLGLLSTGMLDDRPDKSKRMLEIAYSNTNRLVRLISDILDIERIKFGKVAMDKRRCNAADLMVQSADAMRAMAEREEITLSVTSIAAQLWADPDRIIQTLTNLLSNAIKFSPARSTVSLTADFVDSQRKRRRHQENGAYVRFCVKDQGIGIPEDKLDVIFDRFQQVDASNSRQQGGTGLGLTICREIVEQHDGKIWVESRFGEGSAFYFTIPVFSNQS
ncbi:ATP-binding protein [Leptolyngbya sp. NIES-2104]|uniref:ATP-binding protein n=1 Tax=Leptolyngbya sp. NIES-2104 TaxID=1552121 RepID=UPI0006EC460F|nr:ATP-binding protein [Leptolyngbya sp. NIES-2104]GAP94671.1 circadian input kinase A [Leptolyngbya sp. NIES-2104]